MKYNKSMQRTIRTYLRRGVAIRTICKKIEINETTFYQWKIDHPEFKVMVDETKQMIADDLDEPLLKLAKGFTAHEVTREGDKEGKLRVTKKITKKVAPDLGAIKYLKNNVDPANWRERRQIEHSGELELTHVIPPEVQEILDRVKNDKD